MKHNGSTARRALRTTGFPAANFRRALLRWFDAHKRALPWRENRDPYRVWVSEIMLQQTRVAAVLEHYRRFMERFPDVYTLARARQSNVLAAWSGLGYYRRARMMHDAARIIVTKLDGQFPADSKGWRELPGIGRYTSAAIASICWDERCAVVDGNVERVLGRIGCVPAISGSNIRKEVWNRATELLSPQRPGDFNQAMMELGATICTPKAPQCQVCPVAKWCAASTPAERAPLPARRKCDLHYTLVTSCHDVLLVKRSKAETLMPGMWELPLRMKDANPGENSTPEFRVRHSIMNTDYAVHVWRRECRPDQRPECDGCDVQRWVSPRVAARLPLTGLAKKILRQSGIIN